MVEGPPLPAPRTDAANVSVNGRPFIIGGLDTDLKPSTTVYAATLTEGEVTGWRSSRRSSCRSG